jgi:calcineurin-like phosphoesterase family protein
MKALTKLFMFERPLKINHSDNQRVYFTSDTHFNHDKDFVYSSRGYKDRYEHNDALIAKINELVRPQDVLFHLGDFCLNITMPEFEQLIARINCNNIYYIWGNHNSCIRRQYEETLRGEYQRDDIEVYPYKVGKITYLGDYKEVMVNGHLIVLHHYPHQIWNQMQKFTWQLSGHSHYTNPTTQLENVNNRILDVGWDGHSKPLAFNEIQKIMANKVHVKQDKHH